MIRRPPRSTLFPLHDALPIWLGSPRDRVARSRAGEGGRGGYGPARRIAQGRHQARARARREACRSEEHTSELQSRQYLVCRLLLEKKKKQYINILIIYTYMSS